MSSQAATLTPTPTTSLAVADEAKSAAPPEAKLRIRGAVSNAPLPTFICSLCNSDLGFFGEVRTCPKCSHPFCASCIQKEQDHWTEEDQHEPVLYCAVCVTFVQIIMLKPRPDVSKLIYDAQATNMLRPCPQLCGMLLTRDSIAQHTCDATDVMVTVCNMVAFGKACPCVGCEDSGDIEPKDQLAHLDAKHPTLARLDCGDGYGDSGGASFVVSSVYFVCGGRRVQALCSMGPVIRFMLHMMPIVGNFRHIYLSSWQPATRKLRFFVSFRTELGIQIRQLQCLPHTKDNLSHVPLTHNKSTSLLFDMRDFLQKSAKRFGQVPGPELDVTLLVVPEGVSTHTAFGTALSITKK
jgi:hypothetical protein